VKPIRQVALLGLGAVGTLLAARWAARDPAHLRIIADAGRIARFRDEPPSLNGVRLDLQYADPANPGPPADLVLVAVKSTSLATALPAVARFLTMETQIVPLLNGITAQDTLAAAFGWSRVLHGFVYCNSAMRTGHAVVQHGVFKVVFGEAANTPPAPRVLAVAEAFARLGIPYDTPPDMRAAQWRKYILNIGLNQAQAILRVPNRELQQNPAAMRLARELMDEAAAIATALGIPGAGQIPAWVESIIRAAPPEDKTSMLQDIEASRLPENDLFAETICRLGRELGIPTPANARALRHLSFSPPLGPRA
jgi:2-dehydropantoate 2-reductase